jgi:hypothetical protein
MKRFVALASLALAGLPAGCVTRRFVIDSEPRGAIVYRDGQPIGATPVEQPFLYYGKYRFRLVKDGYQPLDVEPQLVAPVYEWPGLDFVSETIIPYTFRDVQRFCYTLQPLEPVRHDDLRRRAGELREQGKTVVPHVPVPPEAQRRGAVPGLGPPRPAPSAPLPGLTPPGPPPALPGLTPPGSPSVLPAPVPVPASGAPGGS